MAEHHQQSTIIKIEYMLAKPRPIFRREVRYIARAIDYENRPVISVKPGFDQPFQRADGENRGRMLGECEIEVP